MYEQTWAQLSYETLERISPYRDCDAAEIDMAVFLAATMMRQADRCAPEAVELLTAWLEVRGAFAVEGLSWVRTPDLIGTLRGAARPAATFGEPQSIMTTESCVSVARSALADWEVSSDTPAALVARVQHLTAAALVAVERTASTAV